MFVWSILYKNGNVGKCLLYKYVLDNGVVWVKNLFESMTIRKLVDQLQLIRRSILFENAPVSKINTTFFFKTYQNIAKF